MRIMPACLINVDLPPIFGPVINTQLALASSILLSQKNVKTSNVCVVRETRKFVTFVSGNRNIGHVLSILRKQKVRQIPENYENEQFLKELKIKRKLTNQLKYISISHQDDVVCQKTSQSTAREINHVTRIKRTNILKIY